MKLRTLIIDDEAPARQRLRRLLSGNHRVELIGEAVDGIKAVEMIEGMKPDLVLLDIQMPGLNGFEVIRALTKPPLIIFVTAYDEFAIQAFEVNALDYLLKPFTKTRLDRAVERAYQESSGIADFSSRINSLLRTVEEQQVYLDRIAVRTKGRILVIDANDIDWIDGKKGHIYIHIKGQAYLANYTLDELENRLRPEIFFRAHRSAIVNLTKAKELIPWFAGSYRVRLNRGIEIDLSRERVKKLRQILKW